MAERIPVVEERLAVEKRRRQTGLVRVEKTSHEEEVPVEAELAVEEVAVERVPIDRFIDGPVPDRQEGDTLVISVVEEVVVIEKRLKVVEEIRITRRRRTRHMRRTATRRREDVKVYRDEA